MQNVIRFILLLTLGIAFIGQTFAKTHSKESEYKQADTNFYLRGDVLKADPQAVILDSGSVVHKGDSYFVLSGRKAPKEVYLQVVNDWLEPITPPGATAAIAMPLDAMQIREPQGDVQVALPSAPANFVPATDQMTIPNGAVIKTGAGGSAAVLMGGVDSARFIPNSEAAMQQTVAGPLRSTEIDLRSGAVFSKVGQLVGEKQDYQVHTPFGVAAARGTDFVTIAMPARTDVWIAQGTVQLDQPDGKTVGTVSSQGTGALKIIRFPAMPDAEASMMASSETMTAAMNFIPTVNLKIKALHDKMAQGVKMSPAERSYLARIKKVPCLIKLDLVEPPPPLAPPPAPAVVSPTPAPAPEAAAPTPAPEAPGTPPGPIPAPESTAPETVTPATVPTIQAHPAMTPRTDESIPPKKTKKKASTSHAAKHPAPISTGPNDTLP